MGYRKYRTQNLAKAMSDIVNNIATGSVKDPPSDAEKKSADKKYGDDPDYADEEGHRYPLNTAEHAKAAWAYINVPHNAAAFSPAKLASMKAKIKAACKKFGIETSED